MSVAHSFVAAFIAGAALPVQYCTAAALVDAAEGVWGGEGVQGDVLRAAVRANCENGCGSTFQLILCCILCHTPKPRWTAAPVGVLLLRAAHRSFPNVTRAWIHVKQNLGPP